VVRSEKKGKALWHLNFDCSQVQKKEQEALKQKEEAREDKKAVKDARFKLYQVPWPMQHAAAVVSAAADTAVSTGHNDGTRQTGNIMNNMISCAMENILLYDIV
jgi:hypothetical protein